MKRNSSDPLTVPDYSGYYDEEPASLRDFAVPAAERVWQIVRNNKLLIAALVAASLLIGVVATLLITPKYEASARIEISRAETNVTSVEGVQTEDQILDAQYYETQYELLKARSLAEQVVREGDLASNAQFLNAFDIEFLHQNPERALATILLDNVRIDPVGTSNLVDISFISPDPALSARIANLWAQEYVASNLNRRFGATAEAREFLESRLAQLRERLEDAERELINYTAERNLFTIETPKEGTSSETAAQTLVASNLQALNAVLAQATAERIAAESALAASGKKLDSSALEQLQQQRSVLSSELAQLRATAGDQYPQVRALTDQVAQLDQEIARFESRVQTRSSNADRARFQEAAQTEQRLRQRVNALREEFVGQRRDSVQSSILQREVDTNRTLYNAILQRYREIGVAGVGENNIALIDAAEVPSVPVEPNLPRNLMLSLLIGIAAAGGVLLLREKLDQSIRDPADVSEILGLPLLGSIPLVGVEEVSNAMHNKHSDLYEAYFSLFTNLGFLSEQGVPKSLMVGSSRPGEGKSLTSVALASIMSDRGKRVLLLDTDMRNSGLFKYLVIGAGKGLSNFLRGEDQWEEMVQTPEPFDFHLIPSGRPPPNAAELIAGDRFSEFLQTLGEHYDHVIVDAPPVLGLADAPLIASAVDGVVIVIEANHGKTRMIAQALDRLERGGGKVFGAVVTKLDQRNQSYGYGYGYGYGYSYGEKPPLAETT